MPIYRVFEKNTKNVNKIREQRAATKHEMKRVKTHNMHVYQEKQNVIKGLGVTFKNKLNLVGVNS